MILEHDCILFNGDHVLYLRPDIGKWMNVAWVPNDGHMIPGNESAINFLTFVLQLWKPLEKISIR